MCGANCRDTGVADRGRTGRTGRGNGLNAENSLVVFVAHGIGRTIDKGWAGRLQKGAGSRHRIDRGTKGTGATVRVWEGRTTFPSLGLGNVVLGSWFGEPRHLRDGLDGPHRSIRAVLIRTLSINRCILRGRSKAQCVSAVRANTIFTATENAEERSPPTSRSAWGRRRLFLRRRECGLGGVGSCGHVWELKIIKIDGFRTARKRTKAGKRVKKSQTPV